MLGAEASGRDYRERDLSDLRKTESTTVAEKEDNHSSNDSGGNKQKENDPAEGSSNISTQKMVGSRCNEADGGGCAGIATTDHEETIS